MTSRNPRRPTDSLTCKHCGQEFRAITSFHLRSSHDYVGDHPVEEYKRRFRLKTASCYQSRKRISEAKETFWARRGQHWTRPKLLAEIRRLQRFGRRLRRKHVPVRVYEAGRRLFGTWQAAIEKAGFDYVKNSGVRRWNQKCVIDQIRELAAAGMCLAATHIAQHYPALHRAALRCFPCSWKKALRAAGFNPNEHKMPRGRWDEKQAVAWVQKRVTSGKSIMARDVPRNLFDFVHRRLRMPWTDFVESLGFPYPGAKKRRDWTKAKVVAELRRLKKERQQRNYAAVKRTYQALIHQARKYFGSWDRARAAAKV